MPELDATAPTSDGEELSTMGALAAHPLLKSMLRVGRVVVFVAVLVMICYAAAVEWSAVRNTIRALSLKSIVAAALAIVFGMFASVRVWQELLASMGTRVRYRAAAQVNLVGQLGKYLPGSVWAFVLQAQLGKRYEIPRARALTTLLLSAGTTSVTALTLAVLAVEPLSKKWGAAAWLLLVGPLSLIAIVPPVLTRIANLALRILRRPQLTRNLISSHVLKAVGWSFVSWLFFGLHLWLLTGSLAKQSMTGFVICTGAYALAMSAGFLAFVLPSGVGVREAVIVGGLAPLAASGPALAIALTSRLLFTVADVTTALVAILFARLSAQRHNVAHNVDH
ncbi:MAG TPA: lysylphosphatidylglycerol synthase transmembrane domain-containing protein [Jatrophihabitans sp.]